MSVWAQVVRDVSGFDVEFVLADGTMRRVDLVSAWNVPFESVAFLDFDPDVVGSASQLFWLHWDENGKSRKHVPDYLGCR